MSVNLAQTSKILGGLTNNSPFGNKGHFDPLAFLRAKYTNNIYNTNTPRFFKYDNKIFQYGTNRLSSLNGKNVHLQKIYQKMDYKLINVMFKIPDQSMGRHDKFYNDSLSNNDVFPS